MFNNFFNKFRKTEEVKEEDKRLNENDLKGYLRKYVPIEDVSSGDEWERYGEDSDEKEEEPELEEREELEEIIEPTATQEEIKEKAWAQFQKSEEIRKQIENKREEIFNKIKNPSIDIEHREEKINRKVERKTQRGMSPEKRVSSFQDEKKHYRNSSSRTSSNKENLKTVSDKKKAREARAKIAKFLDSKEGQDRIV